MVASFTVSLSIRMLSLLFLPLRYWYAFRLQLRDAPPLTDSIWQLPLYDPYELRALVIQLDPARASVCYSVDPTMTVQPGRLGTAFPHGFFFLPDPDVRPYDPGAYPDTGLDVTAYLGGW